MLPNRYRGPPMTPANMRAQGVRSLWVVCDLCHHEAVLNVDGYGDAVPVPAFGPRMVCTSCGIIGAFARPNCQERPTSESLTANIGISRRGGQLGPGPWPAQLSNYQATSVGNDTFTVAHGGPG